MQNLLNIGYSTRFVRLALWIYIGIQVSNSKYSFRVLAGFSIIPKSKQILAGGALNGCRWNMNNDTMEDEYERNKINRMIDSPKLGLLYLY
jgi:hypothetical protein